MTNVEKWSKIEAYLTKEILAEIEAISKFNSQDKK